jgi:ATP-binding cassette, subfamily B (MDR/TAP), member 1
VATIGIARASTLGSDSAKAHNSAISIFRILDRKSKIDPSSGEGLVLDNVRGDIELFHISFRYPTRRDIPVFTNLSLSIPSGKVHILSLCLVVLKFSFSASVQDLNLRSDCIN